MCLGIKRPLRVSPCRSVLYKYRKSLSVFWIRSKNLCPRSPTLICSLHFQLRSPRFFERFQYPRTFHVLFSLCAKRSLNLSVDPALFYSLRHTTIACKTCVSFFMLRKEKVPTVLPARKPGLRSQDSALLNVDVSLLVVAPLSPIRDGALSPPQVMKLVE